MKREQPTPRVSASRSKIAKDLGIEPLVKAALVGAGTKKGP
jgi:hypothetical protein